MRKLLDRLAKEVADTVAPLLIMLLPIAQLTDIAFVTDMLGKWGVPGIIASIVAGYIVAYVKQSPLAIKPRK